MSEHARRVALSKHITHYGQRSDFPYYELTTTHLPPGDALSSSGKKKGLKIPKGNSGAVNQRTDNTIAKREGRKDRQYHSQKRRTKNNDLSNTTHKTQNRTTRTLLKIRDEHDVFWNGKQFLLH